MPSSLRPQDAEHDIPQGNAADATPHNLGDEAPVSDFVSLVAAEEAQADEQHSPISRMDRLKALAAQLVRFGLVGGIGFIVETAVFNALLFTVLAPTVVPGGELWAKVIATLIAIVTNWIGNRLWTFRHDRRSDRGREGLEFFGVSLIGLVVGLVPIWMTGQLLGLTGPIALNLANIVGLGLGSIFRFVCYRWWVFSPHRHRQIDAAN